MWLYHLVRLTVWLTAIIEHRLVSPLAIAVIGQPPCFAVHLASSAIALNQSFTPYSFSWPSGYELACEPYDPVIEDIFPADPALTCGFDPTCVHDPIVTTAPDLLSAPLIKGFANSTVAVKSGQLATTTAPILASGEFSGGIPAPTKVPSVTPLVRRYEFVLHPAYYKSTSGKRRRDILVATIKTHSRLLTFVFDLALVCLLYTVQTWIFVRRIRVKDLKRTSKQERSFESSLWSQLHDERSRRLKAVRLSTHRLEVTIAQMQANMESQNSFILSLQQQISGKDQAIFRACHDHDIQKAIANSFSSSNRDLIQEKADLEQQSRAKDEKIAQLRQDSHKKDTIVNNLRQNNSSLAQENNDLKQQLAARDKELAQLRQDIDLKETETANIRSSNNSHVEEKNKLRQQNAAKGQQIAEARKDSDLKDILINNLERKKNDLVQQNADLDKKIMALGRAYEVLRGQYNDVKTRKSNLELKLFAEKGKLVLSDGKLSIAKAQVESTTEEYNRLSAEHTNLVPLSNLIKNEIAEMQFAILPKKGKEICAGFSNAIIERDAQLRAAFFRSQQENENLNDQVQELTNQVSFLQNPPDTTLESTNTSYKSEENSVIIESLKSLNNQLVHRLKRVDVLQKLLPSASITDILNTVSTTIFVCDDPSRNEQSLRLKYRNEKPEASISRYNKYVRGQRKHVQKTMSKTATELFGIDNDTGIRKPGQQRRRRKSITYGERKVVTDLIPFVESRPRMFTEYQIRMTAETETAHSAKNRIDAMNRLAQAQDKQSLIQEKQLLLGNNINQEFKKAPAHLRSLFSSTFFKISTQSTFSKGHKPTDILSIDPPNTGTPPHIQEDAWQKGTNHWDISRPLWSKPEIRIARLHLINANACKKRYGEMDFRPDFHYRDPGIHNAGSKNKFSNNYAVETTRKTLLDKDGLNKTKPLQFGREWYLGYGESPKKAAEWGGPRGVNDKFHN